MNHTYHKMIIDSKMMSDGSVEEMARAFKAAGKYLGNAEVEVYGNAISDQHLLYVSDVQLQTETVRELFDL